MKKSILVSLISSSLFLASSSVFAAGGHGNHGGSGNKAGGSCKTTIINHIIPAHLSMVEPEAEFSFWVKGIPDPSKVTVTAKKIPVELDLNEMKGAQTVYAFKGRLPADIGKYARVTVSVEDRKCPATKGWLLKINAD